MEVILVKDKWDTYTIANEKGVRYAALDLLKQRVEDDFWYDNWDEGNPDTQWEDRARAIVKKATYADLLDEAAYDALYFLEERNDEGFEYEDIEIQTVKGI